MLAKYIATCTDGETIDHASPFTQNDVDTYLLTADSSNMYVLVRKCIIIIGLAGGMRGGQLRPLTQSCLTEEYDGYLVDFTPIKQRGTYKNMV